MYDRVWWHCSSRPSLVLNARTYWKAWRSGEIAFFVQCVLCPHGVFSQYSAVASDSWMALDFNP